MNPTGSLAAAKTSNVGRWPDHYLQADLQHVLARFAVADYIEVFYNRQRLSPGVRWLLHVVAPATAADGEAAYKQARTFARTATGIGPP